MIRKFIATTAIVGAVFISQNVTAAIDPVPDIFFDYIAKSKDLTKYKTQIETYQELIDEHIADMAKTPTAAEMALLNKYVTKDTTAVNNYKDVLTQLTAEDKELAQAEKEYYEQTNVTPKNLIPVAPPLPSTPPSVAEAEKEVKELEGSETSSNVAKEIETDFTDEEAKKLVEKKVQPKDVKTDIRTDLNAFETALQKQKSKLQDVQESITKAKETDAFKNDPTAEKQSTSLVDALSKALNARRTVMEYDDDEWEEEIEDEWEKDSGSTPS